MCWIFDCFPNNKKHQLEQEEKQVLVASNDKAFLLPAAPECMYKASDNSCIYIQNDKCLSEIRLWDCMSIELINCPRLSKIPCIGNYCMLEILRLQHCDIKRFHCELPECLRVLEISYCGLVEFAPEHVPSQLAELNLSFNKLKMIPRCLENMRHTSMNLKNNDFWFNMYTDISPGMICGEIVDELILAHKMNLVSTSKILYAIRILFEKEYMQDARRLKTATRVEFEIRKKEVKTTAENAQNVHLTSVQNSLANALKILDTSTSCVNMSLDEVQRILQMNEWDKIKTLCASDTVHSIYKVTYFDVLTKVLSTIMRSVDKDVMLDIFRDELRDGLDTCFTGQITRMVNALNGFVKDIKVGISSKEELSNTIIAIRKKYSLIYPDVEEYAIETIPVVWQLLEDMCVPEHEHMAWLEYV